jgi:hypothetical protein
MLDDYTKEQKNAIRQFNRAVKKLKRSGLRIHNCYGHLHFYQGGTVEDVDDIKPTEGPVVRCGDAGDWCSEELWGQWTDDTHYLHLTEKGKKIVEAEREL